MTALIWLIPVALLLGSLGLVAFLWAMRSGQFDDLEGGAGGPSKIMKRRLRKSHGRGEA